MNLEVKNMLVGWGKSFLDYFDLLDEDTKKKSETKLAICEDCSVREGLVCSGEKKGIAVVDFKYGDEERFKGQEYNGCKCPLMQKSMSDSQCPIGKFETLK